MKIRRAHKFRLYPTRAQEMVLDATLGTCREVYNALVHWRKVTYETTGAAPDYYEQKKALAVWKVDHPELRSVHSQVLQEVCKRVDWAFQAFFRRVAAGEEPGYPRLKGHGCYDSLTWPQYGNGALLNGDILTLSKIGDIQTVVHRPLPDVVKTCTVRRQNGKWFACFSCEVECEPLPESAEAVGIDVGLHHIAVTSDGEFLDNPRFLRTEEKALVKAQRKFNRVKHKHRTKARRNAKKAVSRIHERIRNRRHDFVHKTARNLVNRYGLIAVEALQVENMRATPAPKQDADTGQYLPNGASAKCGLNKSIADAAWSMLRTILTQKAESARRKVVAVHPAYTSQECSGCGTRVPKTLKDRWHHCPNPECGLSMHRDVNAARNILHRALWPEIAVGLHSVPA